MDGFVFPNEVHVTWSVMIVLYPYITGLVAGAFIVFYWTLVINSGEDALSNNSLAVWVEGLQSDLTELIGAVPLWLWIPILVVPLAGATTYALRGRERDVLEESTA